MAQGAEVAKPPSRPGPPNPRAHRRQGFLFRVRSSRFQDGGLGFYRDFRAEADADRGSVEATVDRDVEARAAPPADERPFPPAPPRAAIARYSDSVSGVIESRFPRRRICISESAGSARRRSSGTTSANRSTNSTSHISHVGSDGRAFGSNASLLRSNWVGSASAVRVIRSSPAAPEGSAFEW